MAITISGQNNNDKILASDGVLDQISGFNVVGVLTASTFETTGEITANHIDVGSTIQLGNAGIITATTLIGNVTGNVNSTSNLLFQISGSEKFRVGNGGQLGIGGANYGTSGQVLTSGGSSSAATWSTISGTTINNNANNRVITGSGTANTLEGESNLTFSGNTLEVNNIIKLSDAGFLKFGVSNTAFVRGKDDTDGYLQLGTGGAERLRIDSSGRLLLNTTTTYSSNQMMIVKGASPSAGGNRPYDGQLAIEGSETTGAINTGGVLAFIGHDGGTTRGFGSIRNLKEDGTSGNYGTYMSFETRANGSAPAEKLRITSGGTIQCGTNGVLQAFINNSVSGHQFISQCSDNNNGFEVYQKHGSTTTRNTFAVYANTGSGASKQLQFAVRGDGKVGINQSSPQTGLHINQDWVSSYGSISVEGSANALVGLGLRSNGNYRASLIWRDGSSGNYLDISTYGAAYPILFRPNGTEKVRITGGGDLEMTGGTVSLKEHMIRVGNRTTSQINAGVSTATGSLTLDTTENNLKYYANAEWKTIKQAGNDGSSLSLAARSAKALLDDGITTNGVYFLDMHGAYSLGNAKRHYCLMDSSYDGGGWTLLYCMNHGNNFASGTNYSFALNVGSNPTTVNDFIASNFGYDRRNTFTPQANDQFLIRRSDNNDWRRFVVSTWSPTANSVSNGWTTTNDTTGQNRGHPYYALGQMYDTSGNAVSGMIHFNGCALGGNCGSGGGDGDGFGDHINWSSGYSPYSCWGGAYNAQSNGGSPLYWGQTALSQGGSLYVQMFYRKAGTQ